MPLVAPPVTGSWVGVAVTVCDGDWVGDLDGDIDGDLLGDFDGDRLGLGVGDLVSWVRDGNGVGHQSPVAGAGACATWDQLGRTPGPATSRTMPAPASSMIRTNTRDMPGS
nr:hypothetical protein GCM10020063_052740 [Dactylosporangium thailandense]